MSSIPEVCVKTVQAKNSISQTCCSEIREKFYSLVLKKPNNDDQNKYYAVPMGLASSQRGLNESAPSLNLDVWAPFIRFIWGT